MSPKAWIATFLGGIVPTLLLSSAAGADEAQRDVGPVAPRGDYLFPEAGRLSATVGSGVPFLGIGEAAYGFGSGFSVGALAAATPDMPNVGGTAAIGIRPRGVVFRLGSWRSMLVAPILYYPSVPGFGGPRDPWVLAHPEVIVERRLDSGARINLGLGVVGAACVESLLTLGREHSSEVMGGVWDTVRVGGAIPIGHRTSVFGEMSLVMQGIEPARRWIGVTPVIAVTGISWNL